MIKDKHSDDYKDFAFIEYSSIEDATEAMKLFAINPTQLYDSDLFIDFSKLRKIDEIKLQQGANKNDASVRI